MADCVQVVCFSKRSKDGGLNTHTPSSKLFPRLKISFCPSYSHNIVIKALFVSWVNRHLPLSHHFNPFQPTSTHCSKKISFSSNFNPLELISTNVGRNFFRKTFFQQFFYLFCKKFFRQKFFFSKFF